MIRNLEKEQLFYDKDFKFSYSSLSKLLYSPTIFYSKYVLKEDDEKLDLHLLEGKLLHCLLLEPDKFSKNFRLLPDKKPSDSVINILYKLKNKKIVKDLCDNSDEWKNLILETLKEENLYQSLNEDSSRLAKIQTKEAQDYWSFIIDDETQVIDSIMYKTALERVNLLKENNRINVYFNSTDFELENLEFVEQYLECNFKNYKFGLKGYVDKYIINDSEETITIIDFKTTGKTIADFHETIEFYNYWLQCAIYSKLVYENVNEKRKKYTIDFKFIVIDKYNQSYVFDVTYKTLYEWTNRLENVLHIAAYHYNNNLYDLPYEYSLNKIKL